MTDLAPDFMPAEGIDTPPAPAAAAPGDTDPHDIIEAHDGTKLLEYRLPAGDHDLAAGIVLARARMAGHDVIGLPDRVKDTSDATHWRVQVSGKRA